MLIKEDNPSPIEDEAIRDFLILKMIWKSYITNPKTVLAKKKLKLSKEDLADCVQALGPYYVKSIKKQIDDFLKKRKTVFYLQHIQCTITMEENHYIV